MHDLEVWKASLLYLPEQEFFAIIRNYIGPVQTPFNKHRIIDRLVSFLKQKETIDRTITLLDERDIEVLIPLCFLDNIRFDDLLIYFEHAVPFLELHRHLRNLEERLILFRDTAADPPVLKINPILRKAVEHRIRASLQETLSITDDGKPVYGENIWVEDNMLAALFSLLNSFPDIYKADGNLRRKTEHEIAARAPILLEPTPYGKKIDLLLQAAAALGLVRIHKGKAAVSFYHWEELGRISLLERQNLIYAALIRACLKHRSIEAEHDNMVLFLSNLLDTVPERTALAEETLTRLVKIQLLKAGIFLGNAEEITYLLLLLGIFTGIGPHRVRKNHPDHSTGLKQIHKPEDKDGERPLIVQANFTVSVKPWFPLDKSLQVASMATIVQYDLFSTYEITKNSFLTALRRGLTADKAATWLEEHSEASPPQNVVFSLQAWEREFTHIALYRGTVLSVSDEMQHFIEHTGFIEAWVKKRLAPGLYLLDSQEEANWTRAMRESGIEYVPDTISADRMGGEEYGEQEKQQPLYSRLTDKAGAPSKDDPLRKLFNPVKESGSGDAHLLLDHLKQALETSSLPPEMKEEYEARIENKLILYPDQLRPLEPRPTHDEAKGLDYMGKVRVIEHALHNNSTLLEIVERTRAGKPKSSVIKPRSLDQSGEDLLLKGDAMPGGEEVAVRVGKISLVRKVRGSLFS
jgi:hypothetical protein